WRLQRGNSAGGTAAPIQLAVLYPEIRAPGADANGLRELLYHLLTSSLRSSGVNLVQEVSIAEMADRGATGAEISDSLRGAAVDSVLVLEATPGPAGAYLLSVALRRLTTEASEIIAGPISVSSLTMLKPDSTLNLVKMLSGQVASHLGLRTQASSVPQTANRAAFDAYSRGKDAYAKRTAPAIRE